MALPSAPTSSRCSFQLWGLAISSSWTTCPPTRARQSAPPSSDSATLRYLPPYSPDFNPIENAFAKLKALLRKAEARTRDELWGAVSDALACFPASECANYFAAAGYEPT